MNSTEVKTITQVRQSFWEMLKEVSPELIKHYRKTWRQNQYNATIRSMFVDHVDFLRRDEQISEKLANRVTL